NFRGTALVLDIVGFTAMTQSFIDRGKLSAEIVSDIINDIFNETINAIHAYNGSVISFAGDSITAVFDSRFKENSVNAALEINRIISRKKFGYSGHRVSLVSRIGLAYGNISRKIIESGEKNLFYFRGSGLDLASKAEKVCKSGQVIIDQSLARFIKFRPLLKKVKPGYFSVKVTRVKLKKRPNQTYLSQDPGIAARFISDSILTKTELGEYRFVTSVFVKIKKSRIIDSVIKEIAGLTIRFKGHLNKIIFSGDECTTLIIFGAPVGVEHPVKNALDFCFELVKHPKHRQKLMAGLSSGMVYAGVVGNEIASEYTVIGNSINLSSRILALAKHGDIYTDRNIKKDSEQFYTFKSVGRFKLKGFPEIQEIFSAESRVRIETEQFTGVMVGREKEFLELTRQIKKLKSDDFARVIYLDGPAGIGKSRLLFELKKTLPRNQFNWFEFKCDPMVKEGLNPVTGFISSYFEQNEFASEKVNKQKFNHIFRVLLNQFRELPLTQQFNQLKVFLGSLARLTWPGSLYEKLSPQDKFSNQADAFKTFIKLQSLLRPTILCFEDAENLDNDTKTLIQKLLINVSEFKFMVVFSSRFGKSGEKHRLNLERIQTVELELKPLS
ncbi:MAG TPA: adenylate/guanylate cyclase domain-containing protein, partial [Firmicutes bacterium]|nr:adenylate/guanylate cyclase domain-containing protein [Bacillota bacterium]